jgi:uncharacterized membrane protein
MVSGSCTFCISPTLCILLLWIGFGATHIGLSSLPIRSRSVARVGEPLFRVLYSLVALVFFIPLVSTFFAHKHGGTWLWMSAQGLALRWTMYVGVGFAFILLVASFVRPSPVSAVLPADPVPRGVFRITRHPFAFALAIFALLHLPPNMSSGPDVAFCSGLVTFSVLACWHQDRRNLALRLPGFREFYEETPFLPLTGHHTLQGIREVSPTVVALAIGATVVARYFQFAD